MRFDTLKSLLCQAGFAAAALLASSGAAWAQQQVNLSAGPATATLPDGTAVPMWGYTCGAPVASTTAGPPATCAALHPTAAGGWSPVIITVPTGQALTINLTNNLSFSGGGIPTSLVVVGQVGGGLGGGGSTVASPTHVPYGVTWSTVGTGPTFTAPQQGNRVQSFATEVAPGAAGTTALVWSSLQPGTYLIESGTHPSIQGPMGLYGILVVTNAPGAAAGVETSSGTAYGTTSSGVHYDAEVPVLLSEIDPVQNAAVAAAVNTVGFSETQVWSGQPGQCGNPASTNYQTCYPPAVNYSPLYYLINGSAFDKTNATNSLFAVSPPTLAPAVGTGTATGSVLVRLVNAGLRMHVPAIVGAQTTVNGVTSGGFALIAEDGNLLPGIPRVQSEVFLAAGKTYDVMINGTVANAPSLPVYDRQLSLSGNATSRDAGMLAYIGQNGSGVPGASAIGAATANADTYNAVIPGGTINISDPSKGVIANDINVYSVKVATGPTQGTLTLNPNGTFTYVASSGWTGSDSFTYCGNGATTGAACATVTLNPGAIEAASGITLPSSAFSATVSSYINVPPPGILAGAVDAAGHPLSVVASSVSATTLGGGTLSVQPNGSFSVSGVTVPGTYTFTFNAQNSQGTAGLAPATVSVTFPTGSGLNVSVVDPTNGSTITDYRWIIEEDRTFYVDPACAQNPVPATGTAGKACPGAGGGVVPTYGANFHTSDMPFVAQGCTGTVSCEAGQTVLGQPSVCDVGNGACRPDPTGNGHAITLPSSVVLDPAKRYYISILPGDASNPFASGNTKSTCGTFTTSAGATASSCGHGMGGAPIGFNVNSGAVVTVGLQPTPFPPGVLSVFVFEDDFPLNGEVDSGGGLDVLAPYEPGLGGFQIHLWDAMGGNGDFTGQMSYDMFNMPLSNSLDGTIDPVTGLDACAVTKQGLLTATGTSSVMQNGTAVTLTNGITGMIVTCPRFEGDGKGQVLSPLAGQAVIKNLMPGRFGIIATPGADRIARGEEWHQTNTLDGQKAHDSFVRIGEPGYFQEFGPAGYHVTIGFANPAIINARLPAICAGTDPNVSLPHGASCGNTIMGKATTERMSRTPDERLYSSGTHDSFYWTQCYVSVGDPDGEDFAFTKCNADGTFKLNGIPDGQWRVTVFDEWNDALVDGLSTPATVGPKPAGNGPVAAVCPGSQSTTTTCDLGDVALNQWQMNVYTKTFIDTPETGVLTDVAGTASLPAAPKPGIPLIPVSVRYRDGSLANNLLTDFTGTANFNETFPLFNWYVVESDVTRYKNTGTHTVYDAGGPADGSASCGDGTSFPACGKSTIGSFLANTNELWPVPTDLRVPGSKYCLNADCFAGDPGFTTPTGTAYFNVGATTTTAVTTGSTGRVDNPWLGGVEGVQGFSGQNNFIEFGKAPYAEGENGGIHGHVVYASTRPFDDPQMLVQTQWEPLVAHVTVNLYQEGTAPDGSQTLTLVDTTQTSSWDDWAQGFHANASGAQVPNMSCPGQTLGDLFFFTLAGQPMYLDLYNNGGDITKTQAVPYNAQFKCYDGMHNWNQLQPAPYDGMYQFPSVTKLDPVTGKPTASNCKICTPDPATDQYAGVPMLPVGKYVVEVVPPTGYELVKEEDKNILIGDNFIAPAAQQFIGLGNIFILPDQASVAAAYNANNAQNSTNSFGATPNDSTVPAFPVEPVWPCVGAQRIVPDYISLYPQTLQVAPFAGATRNLCDRKEVTLATQTASTAKFFIYTSTHRASKFTGVITDDFTSEFDPFSPQFGEKFSPPNVPVSVKDWSGQEVSRVYSDQWGDYNGMTYSTWEVNPPNPTGYSPTMMVMCMNDPGNAATPDPFFNPSYSQFCYELPFMPAQTQYLDTPVVPTAAFIGSGYNNPDCAYPDATPAVSEVDGDSTGPWVAKSGSTLTINALGNQVSSNYSYSGPAASVAPYNQKTQTRHYGFLGRCTSPDGTATCTTPSQVTIGGVPATIVSWNDTQIQVQVPAGIPACAVQQQTQYGGSPAQCGQLQITSGNGQQSIDTVTVTVGGKAPTLVTGNAPMLQSGLGSIQKAINAAQPGDLIMIPPGQYQEMLVMWKPVRLQGVGAASSVINANTQPAGKMSIWRNEVSCLFGLATNGNPIGQAVPNQPSTVFNSDGTSVITCDQGTFGASFLQQMSASVQSPQIDRLPLEGIVGWDTTTNGNLAQLLQEPTLMGAYEGAGITVLSKGVNTKGLPGYYGSGAEATFPTGSVVLGAKDCTSGAGGTNPYPSNFQCNPSSIDGLTVTDSSQGGGGIFVHAWAHNLQIANNRIHGNIGTLSGGINIGQGESPDAYIAGTTSDTDPGSCQTSNVLDQQLPYCFDLYVNVHHNNVTSNQSIGDELFSGTPAGAGGVSFCTGADYYKFNFNWVCGNMSTGDGGGLSHVGFIYNGDIEHNTIIFNQSSNPTITTNGGGIVVMGAAPDGLTAAGVECGSTVADLDCIPGLSDGTGPNLVINANLIMGNAASSGSGGGLRLQAVNGTEVSLVGSKYWNSVAVTNNIIVNNVAGWDGGGVSLQDALIPSIVNNTIASNDSTASAGVLFNTLGAPLASAPGTGNQTTSSTTSLPQPAGLVTMPNSPQLLSSYGGSTGVTIKCPANNPHCDVISSPYLANDLFYQNRSFQIGVGALSPAYQQNIVSLFNAAFSTNKTGTAPGSQATTGQCVAGSSYWDIGVRGDSGPGIPASGFKLAPVYSLLTNASESTAGQHNITAVDAQLTSQYCNGARTPPEAAANLTGFWKLAALGWQVPPGISDATVPNPVFNLTPNATVDEGNNWVNMSWGPLAVANPSGTTLGNYSPRATSPVIDQVPLTSAAGLAAPKTDFFGNPRPDSGGSRQIDIGAVEFQAPGPMLSSIVPSTGYRGYTTSVDLLGATLTGTTAVNVTRLGIPAVNVVVSGVTVVNADEVTANFAISRTAVLGTDQVTVTTPLGTSNPLAFTVANPPAPTLASIAPASGTRNSSVNVTLSGTWLLTATSLTAPAGSGLTVSNFTVVNDTTVTATIAISGTATLNVARALTLTTLGGTTTVAFTVIPPTLGSISPASGVVGSSVPVTLTGVNLQAATSVMVSGTGVTVGNFAAVNSTTVTATLNIAATAALGSRNVAVVTGAGTTNPVAFTLVAPPAPTLAAVAPAAGLRGTPTAVTLTGSNFIGGATVAVAGGGVSVSNVVVVNATTLTATFTPSLTTVLGARDLTVTTIGGSSVDVVTFTVLGPVLATVAPASVTRGDTVPITLTGSGLTGATAITVSGTGVTANGLTVVNDTTVKANLVATAGAAAGARNLTVTTPAGTSAPVTLTVASPPNDTLTSVAPNAGVRGTAVNVTLTGTNFTTTGETVAVSGGGVTVSSVSVVSPTSITATFTLSATAGLGAHNVTVTNADGVASAAVTFTVSGPTLIGLSPNSIVRGTTTAVTLAGTNLGGATGITVAGTGITASNVTVVDSGTLTASLTATAGATLGAEAVTVATTIGNATGASVQVTGASLSAIAPAALARGTSTLVTINGSNLAGATALALSGNATGVTISNVVAVNATTVTATITLAANAATGTRNVTVTTPIGPATGVSLAVQ